MDRDGYEMHVKVGPNWIPLSAYKDLKAQRAETAGAVVFLAVLSLAAFLMLWGM